MPSAARLTINHPASSPSTRTILVTAKSKIDLGKLPTFKVVATPAEKSFDEPALHAKVHSLDEGPVTLLGGSKRDVQTSSHCILILLYKVPEAFRPASPLGPGARRFTTRLSPFWRAPADEKATKQTNTLRL
jgi:hypothetical protein